MDRNTLVTILGALPEDKLLKMLSVIGLAPTGGEQGADFLGALDMDAAANNKIQPWNDRTVPYNGGTDRPAIADKKWAEGAGGVGQAMDPRLGQIDDGVDPTNIFLQTGGGT